MRLARTRSAASGACRAGHVRVNGGTGQPAHAVRAGDEVRLRYEGRERVVVVQRVIIKRAGAPVAAGCYIDNSPPPPPRGEAVAVAVRDRGTGRPTKRECRSIEKLLQAGPLTRFSCTVKTGLPRRGQVPASASFSVLPPQQGAVGSWVGGHRGGQQPAETVKVCG